MSDVFLERQCRVLSEHISGGRFLDQTVVDLVAKTELTPSGESRLRSMNLAVEEPSLALAEAFARQTYLAYPKASGGDGKAYVGKLLRELGHRSITSGTGLVHFVAGLTVPAATHLIQAGAFIGRLTTSNTKAQNEPVYRLVKGPVSANEQRAAISDFLELKRRFRKSARPEDSENGTELFNLCDLLLKSISLFHSCSAKELFKLVARLDPRPAGLTELSKRFRADYLELFPDQFESSTRPAPQPVVEERSLEELGAELEGGLFVVRPAVQLVRPAPKDVAKVVEIYGGQIHSLPITFDLYGLAQETILEFVSHREATVEPMVGEWTRKPLYRIQGTATQRNWQKQFINAFRELELPDLYSGSPYFSAELFELGSRASAIRLTMTIGDFHKLFIGRLSHHGNEQDVQALCRAMAGQLREHFFDQIRTVDEYYQMSNQRKPL